MKTKGLLTIAFLFGLLFSIEAADHVKGNGKLSTKKITIGDYNAIKIDGIIDFNYVQSEETPFIEVTVDENLHSFVNIDTASSIVNLFSTPIQSSMSILFSGILLLAYSTISLIISYSVFKHRDF